MTRILLSGCNGKMGRVITACTAERCDCEIVAGFDVNTESHAGFPVFANPANCILSGDVVIDFSHPSALTGILRYAKEHGVPAVIATTGLSPEQVEEVKGAAQSLPVFYSGNMSLGISLITELARKAATVLGNDFDVEIIEKHHNQKIDAPSGTALMLLDAVKSAYPDEREAVFGRHGRDCKRQHQEIGMHSLRGGTVTGEHEVCFFGTGERIRISHSAENRGVFAAGALRAAAFLMNRQPGMYSMDDVVGQL